MTPQEFIAFLEEYAENSRKKKLERLSYYIYNGEKQQMINEIRFRDLPATNNYKCYVMLENKMQCQERASIEYISRENDSELSPPNVICKHHFAVERALNEAEGIKYIFYDQTGMKVLEEKKETYQPPQK